MSHYCEGALITCEDFRLHQRKDGRNYVAEFTKSLGIDCDLITRGGGIQDLVRPKEEGFDKSVLRDTEVSAKLHNASTIFLLNHEDCGAYSSMNFSSREEELAQHKKDLLAAQEMILREFPGKIIKLFFAKLEHGKEDVYIINELR
ncbi:MAG: carbonic anhydrase [Patescibacteria group bacterium]